MTLSNKDKSEDEVVIFEGGFKKNFGEVAGEGDFECEIVTDDLKGKMPQSFGTLKHKLGDALQNAGATVSGAGDCRRD